MPRESRSVLRQAEFAGDGLFAPQLQMCRRAARKAADQRQQRNFVERFDQHFIGAGMECGQPRAARGLRADPDNRNPCQARVGMQPGTDRGHAPGRQVGVGKDEVGQLAFGLCQQFRDGGCLCNLIARTGQLHLQNDPIGGDIVRDKDASGHEIAPDCFILCSVW